jgi:rhodanese-related sulfurtransferase
LSHNSARKAVKLGYKNVKVFAAGYPAWKKFAGEGPKMAAIPGAVKKATSKSIKAGKEEGSIDIEAFKKILKENPDSIMLVDVRDPDEYTAGSLKTAVNIPTDQLEKKVQALPVDKPIVFICNTGARSGEAYYMVKDLRPSLKDVYYLEAECTYKKGGEAEIKAPK